MMMMTLTMMMMKMMTTTMMMMVMTLTMMMFTIVQLAASVGETNEVTNICRSLDKAAFTLHNSYFTQFLLYTNSQCRLLYSTKCTQCTQCTRYKYICANSITLCRSQDTGAKCNTMRNVECRVLSLCKWTVDSSMCNVLGA